MPFVAGENVAARWPNQRVDFVAPCTRAEGDISILSSNTETVHPYKGTLGAGEVMDGEVEAGLDSELLVS
jgi:hypothetical protein